MADHVFGEYLERKYDELCKVTKPGGMIVLCPGNNDVDNDTHIFLRSHGFVWSRFEEPRDGMKRKYLEDGGMNAQAYNAVDRVLYSMTLYNTPHRDILQHDAV